MQKLKMLSLLLTITVLSGLAACGKAEENGSKASSKTVSENSSGAAQSEGADSAGNTESQAQPGGESSGTLSSQSAAAASSKQNQSAAASSKKEEPPPVKTLTNFEMWTGNDFWRTGTVYNETVTMYRANGSQETGGYLMQTPTSVVSVKSFSLKTTYQEGKDYKISGNKITIPAGSAITGVLTENDYFPPDKNAPRASEWRKGGGTLLYTEDTFIVSKQICVTYRFDKTKWSWAPKASAAKLPKTMAKLKNKQKVQMAVIGCSTSTGCNSSSFLKTAPFMPPWTELIRQKLADQFSAEVGLSVFAKGGQTTEYGITQASTVGAKKPDIVLIEFGMNDGTFNMSNEVFGSNLETIISIVRKGAPDAEFILLAPLIANPDSVQAGTQENYLAVMNQISNKLNGVAAADFTGLNKAMLSGSKRYVDLSANNINHPSDFMQTAMCAAVVGLFHR